MLSAHQILLFWLQLLVLLVAAPGPRRADAPPRPAGGRGRARPVSCSAPRCAQVMIAVAMVNDVVGIFFATAGLRVDLGLLADPEVALWGGWSCSRRAPRSSRAPTSAAHWPGSQEERERLEEDSVRAEAVQHVLEDARAFAARMGVRAETVIRSGTSASQEVLALARERAIDLLVIAANLRQLSGRAFRGLGVTELLEEAEATVFGVTAAPGWVR